MKRGKNSQEHPRKIFQEGSEFKQGLMDWVNKCIRGKEYHFKAKPHKHIILLFQLIFPKHQVLSLSARNMRVIKARGNSFLPPVNGGMR